MNNDLTQKLAQYPVGKNLFKIKINPFNDKNVVFEVTEVVIRQADLVRFRIEEASNVGELTSTNYYAFSRKVDDIRTSFNSVYYVETLEELDYTLSVLQEQLKHLLQRIKESTELELSYLEGDLKSFLLFKNINIPYWYQQLVNLNNSDYDGFGDVYAQLVYSTSRLVATQDSYYHRIILTTGIVADKSNAATYLHSPPGEYDFDPIEEDLLLTVMNSDNDNLKAFIYHQYEAEDSESFSSDCFHFDGTKDLVQFTYNPENDLFTFNINYFYPLSKLNSEEDLMIKYNEFLHFVNMRLISSYKEVIRLEKVLNQDTYSIVNQFFFE